MRENVYVYMGIIGLVFAFIGASMVIIDNCCYDVLSGITVYLFIVMMLSAIVLVGAAHRRLKD